MLSNAGPWKEEKYDHVDLNQAKILYKDLKEDSKEIKKNKRNLCSFEIGYDNDNLKVKNK